MNDARIQSHSDPKKMYLKEHVAQIRAALKALLEQLGEVDWRTSGGEAMAFELAWMHDLGKASAGFQQYIADPQRWRGDKLSKAHTLLSMVLAIAGVPPLIDDPIRTVALSLAIRGHHGGQPEGDELYNALADDLKHEALCGQIPTVDASAIEREINVALALPGVTAEGLIRSVRKQLRAALGHWRTQTTGTMLRERFVARAAYSLLLEADKAFLAVDRSEILAYLHRPRRALSAALVDRHCQVLGSTPMDSLRHEASLRATEGLERHRDAALVSLTLPTGAGKTLIAARWALNERLRHGDGAVDAPTVIIALPMLSIVDQTEEVYRQVLGAAADDGDMLLPCHSLSERRYDTELPEGTAEFFIDTWRSEVVVTTFDQLLLALVSDQARHAMRYHRLLNARIIVDEVQCIPPALWATLSAALETLATLGRTRVLAMSATPSPCIQGAIEALADPSALYATLARYEIHLAHRNLLDFEAFITLVVSRCEGHMARREGVLVTVNTRATAQAMWQRLHDRGFTPLLLSGDLTPSHRLAVIARVKENPAQVVVSTQCVEAGVDLDMHHVIRDLAPLDSLVQIAGRCNRHGHRTEAGTVTMVHALGAENRNDATVIYDPVLLQCTRTALGDREVVPEREVLGICRDYYALLAWYKDTGSDHLTRWLRIESSLDVRSLLRGEQREERDVLVVERDPELREALQTATREPDRWTRRTRLRKLAARVARQTVKVPTRVFERLHTAPLGTLGVWSELLPGQYDPTRGVYVDGARP